MRLDVDLENYLQLDRNCTDDETLAFCQISHARPVSFVAESRAHPKVKERGFGSMREIRQVPQAVSALQTHF